jgi:hypothetical protein
MMADFEPDERQRGLIEQALRRHRKAQSRHKFAPDRLVEKWTSETAIGPERQGGDDIGMRGAEDDKL